MSLVLTRHAGQAIFIGSNIRIVVDRIDQNGGVRLSIDAPANLSVDRAEIRADKAARGVRGPRTDYVR